jgi:hypothetical protein
MSGMSIREQVLQVVQSRLGGQGSPAANVFRSKLDQIVQADLPCYDVTPGDEKVDGNGGWSDRESETRTLQVVVRAIMDATTQETGDDPALVGVLIDDSAFDPFYVFAVQQIVGADGLLGGLVNAAIEMDGRPVFQPEGKNLIGLEMTFEFKFATKRGDPTQKG